MILKAFLCPDAGFLSLQLFLLIIWSPSLKHVVSSLDLVNYTHLSTEAALATPPSSGMFDPIEISPAVVPHYPKPSESFPPMYPTLPTTYEPNLTGRCPVDFSSLLSIFQKTASDCSVPLAGLVGHVICCPQLVSLLRIFQGFYNNADKLVLQNAVANDCFSDIISIVASKGANNTIPMLCSVKASNLTGGSCPVKDINSFEKLVNTSKLVEACGTVDPMKECCRPVCQPAITEAALQISGTEITINDNRKLAGEPIHIDTISDCKGVVYSYLSKKLSADAANTAYRILSACKVNKGTIFSSLIN